MWLRIHAGIKVTPCYRSPQDVSAGQNRRQGDSLLQLGNDVTI